MIIDLIYIDLRYAAAEAAKRMSLSASYGDDRAPLITSRGMHIYSYAINNVMLILILGGSAKLAVAVEDKPGHHVVNGEGERTKRRPGKTLVGISYVRYKL